jgi:glycosyltransferase involved in cell wall biosynthesis
MEPGSQIVGVVARLEPEKGHPTLLEAWPGVVRAVPDAYLLVVGEGSRREELEAQARTLRIAHRVVFTGRRDDVPAVTAALDVAVLPSYREAQGLSVLEAMACRPGCRVNVGGIPEMITDGTSRRPAA